ncbi:MAG: RNA pseudouridine synthase, partial [Cytophagales bacterium]
MDLNIIFEDNHLLAVNKPNGMLTQKDSSEDPSLEDLARQFVKSKYNKPGDAFLHATHRIDRPVSGVVLFAKTSKALARMNDMFKNKTIKKTYLALVHGHWETEKTLLRNWLIRDGKSNKSRVVQKPGGFAQEAVLHVESIGSIGGFTMVSVELETGRHHQIRCQLSHLRHPIVGDSKYGSEVSTGPAIYLHAH